MSRIDVELKNVQKRFGAQIVVDQFNLQIHQGECVTFLGPSGCGKTTTLNMIAGFLEPDQGEIYIKGKRMNGIPPNKRGLGMVFQTYSLFPHMTVAQNVAYGLKLRKVPKAEIQERVRKVLELVRLPHVADRYPKQLSGGQRQRIAIARALVTEPSLLLLDEPLSNLDAKLREELREELKRLQQEIGITTIFVTHDQEEAMYLSDRIVVLNHGKVEQIGTPWEIYHQPASEFVHQFVGKTNRIAGTVEQIDPEGVLIGAEGGLRIAATRKRSSVSGRGPAAVFVRPEKIRIKAVKEEPPFHHWNEAVGRVKLISFLGSYTECTVSVGALLLSVRLDNLAESMNLKPGTVVQLSWNAEDVYVFPGKEAGT